MANLDYNSLSVFGAACGAFRSHDVIAAYLFLTQEISVRFRMRPFYTFSYEVVKFLRISYEVVVFLRNKKKSYYCLVSVLDNKTVDIKTLSDFLGHGRLSFGSPEDMLELLKLYEQMEY